MDNDKAYREEVRNLASTSARQRIMDYRKWRAEDNPIHIDEAVVEQVESFLSIHTQQCSHEEDMTLPLLPQIHHGPSDLQKVIQLRQ
jgi:hypothetical protein